MNLFICTQISEYPLCTSIYYNEKFLHVLQYFCTVYLQPM